MLSCFFRSNNLAISIATQCAECVLHLCCLHSPVTACKMVVLDICGSRGRDNATQNGHSPFVLGYSQFLYGECFMSTNTSSDFCWQFQEHCFACHEISTVTRRRGVNCLALGNREKFCKGLKAKGL